MHRPSTIGAIGVLWSALFWSGCPLFSSGALEAFTCASSSDCAAGYTCTAGVCAPESRDVRPDDGEDDAGALDAGPVRDAGAVGGGGDGGETDVDGGPIFVHRRQRDGLIALYPFAEGGGQIVRDRSGFKRPLNLRIRELEGATWVEGALDLSNGGGSGVWSERPAIKVSEAVRQGSGLTLEAWITPTTPTSDGPDRIVSISPGSNATNVMLGLRDTRYLLRMRTTDSDDNGIPEVRSPVGTVETALTHLVATHDVPSETTRLYVNGALVDASNVDQKTGDFSTWSLGYTLSLGDEPNGSSAIDRHFFGQMHLVAIYDRALSPETVATHFAAGPCVDDDGDGHGVGCASGPDCDDADPGRIAGTRYWVDRDDDGFRALDPILVCVDDDPPPDAQSSTPVDFDCDDGDIFRQPGLTELCDGLDNDCDGRTDENDTCACDHALADGDTLHAYLFCSGDTSWDDARDYCAERGYALVAIDHEGENAFIDQATNNDWWIGLSDRSNENTFVWTNGRVAWTDGSTVRFANWRDGEPNNGGGNEHCVEMDGFGRWNDKECTDERPFVCEADPDLTAD